ncbi:hypothetical protein EBU02_03385 [bacterium]|nr:hypothetical protein [bacterium]
MGKVCQELSQKYCSIFSPFPTFSALFLPAIIGHQNVMHAAYFALDFLSCSEGLFLEIQKTTDTRRVPFCLALRGTCKTLL